MLGTLGHLGRLAYAGGVLAQHRALAPGNAPVSPGDGARRGKRLAKALEKLGPSYIKLGQLLATRPDLIGAGPARGLSDLHDRLPAFSMKKVERILFEDFGLQAATFYSEFSAPVAAASIAQVHKAKIDEEGGPRTVAVKVLRPGVRRAFRRDLDSFYAAARLATRFKPSTRRLRPIDVVRTLEDSVRQEMDLRIEAAAASEMAENTAGDDDFRVPRIDWTRTSARVLTSEWIDGIPLTDKEKLIASGADLPRLARLVLQNFLRHAIRDGFFHADMHPGNLFLDREGHLTAVDFGIMGRLDRPTRRFMADMLHGFITRDYERVARVHFDAGYVPPHQSVEEFALALRATGEPIWGRPVSEISMGKMLTQLLDTTRRFDMELQPSLLLLQKTMVAAEGVARDLDPNISIWDCAKPIVEEWLHEEMGPQALIAGAAETARAFGRLAARGPKLAEDLENAIRVLSETAKERTAPLPPEPRKPSKWLLAIVGLLTLMNAVLLGVLIL